MVNSSKPERLVLLALGAAALAAACVSSPLLAPSRGPDRARREPVDDQLDLDEFAESAAITSGSRRGQRADLRRRRSGSHTPTCQRDSSARTAEELASAPAGQTRDADLKTDENGFVVGHADRATRRPGPRSTVTVRSGPLIQRCSTVDKEETSCEPAAVRV